jgi:lipopolysaccharide transport system permease protein
MRELRPFRNLWQNRYLIRQLAKREIAARYRGSCLGFLWPFLVPLVMLAVYTCIFGVIFKATWSEDSSSGLADYAVQLFAGLVVFQVFQECVARAPTLIIEVPNYVKKVVFPLEVLPLSILMAAVFQGVISSLILLAFNFMVNHTVHTSVVWLPVVWLPLLAWCVGVVWIVAAIGVYVRDVQHVVVLGLQILFFATPILYPLTKVPPRFVPLLQLNPLSGIIANQRSVLIAGTLPSWSTLVVGFLSGAVVAGVGYAFFMHTKKGFADVI